MAQASLDDMRILIVEDVDAIRGLVARILKGLGCAEVFEAPDIATAWPILTDQKLDLMLLDYELEDTDGLKLMRRLRAADDLENCQLPTIVLTAHAESHVVEAAVASGADGYLVKPVMPDRLGERIQQVVKARRDGLASFRATEVNWKANKAI